MDALAHDSGAKPAHLLQVIYLQVIYLQVIHRYPYGKQSRYISTSQSEVVARNFSHSSRLYQV